ncbi:Protein of unknown function [Cryobacterium psychrotolerans]|uniref:Uncharacterized protein n=1 Tax=Cryobacterium psychrotolerans TaxID=386301 RepID=A0A1G9BDT4_9MICO|nr:DUF3263 domain-containing protein [Cryobacterium psychrotolerans]TFD84707.1 DUF3263 domain-containing protein [Cryobacterium psychrotolerans]SDK37290.1 Protein of unknown function [Cryobacterium psychrotolerans]
MFTERHRAILEFEMKWTPGAGESKRDAIRHRFGIGVSRYHQILRYLCFQPEARDFAPEFTEPWLDRQPVRVRQLTSATDPTRLT